MKKYIKLAFAAATLASAALTASAAGPLAAKVNNVQITAQEVDEFIRAKGPSGLMLGPGSATEQLIEIELLAQEALRRGQDRSAGRVALARGVVKEFMDANPLSEAEVKREYELVKAAQPKEKEYKISMIVLKTEAEANRILASLAAGKSFASFVSRSNDERSRENGGAVDWMRMENMRPTFVHALLDMKAGTVAKEPVREDFGFVVLRLDEVRNISFPAYAEVRDNFVQSVLGQRRAKLMGPLAEKASIQQFEGYVQITLDMKGDRSYGPYVRKVETQR